MAEILASVGGSIVLNNMGATAGIVEQVSRPVSPLLVD
jgi:hypothetical protein